MSLTEESTLLRILIGEADEVHGRPLYKAIVTKARELHMAGATVLRGPLGFGRSSMLHTEKILRLSQDLPMVIEIVDADEKIGEQDSSRFSITTDFALNQLHAQWTTQRAVSLRRRHCTSSSPGESVFGRLPRAPKSAPCRSP